MFITEDLRSGRMVDVIDSAEPAIIVCHWPGIYFNGEKIGFNIMKQVVKRLDQKYDNLNWMKLSEIARYWAAKELTTITLQGNILSLSAPFATPGFTLKINSITRHPGLRRSGVEIKPFSKIADKKAIKANTWYSDKTGSILCFDLEKGSSELVL